MVDVKELCEDGYRLAIQAVDLDKIGSGNAAAFFYIEAAEALIKALSYDPSLDVKDKASQYIRRAEELRALEEGGIVTGNFYFLLGNINKPSHSER